MVIFQLSIMSLLSQRTMRSLLPEGGTLDKKAAPASRGKDPAGCWPLLLLLSLLLPLLLLAGAELRMYLCSTHQAVYHVY